METIRRLLRFLLVDNGAVTLTAALGFAAVFLLLPRPRPLPRLWGAAAAALALVLGGAHVVRAGALTVEAVLFYAFSGIAVVAGGMLVTQANPARAALSFALVVLSTCGLFLLLAAPFLMAATIIIYAGAIVVTFLFVIMLARQEGLSDADQRSREPLLGCVTGFVLLAALLYVLHATYSTRDLDEMLARVRRAKEAPTVKAMAEAIGDDSPPPTEFFKAYKRAVVTTGRDLEPPPPEAQALRDAVENLEGPWLEARARKDVEKARAVWTQLEDIGRRARESYGFLQPASGTPLSDLSGPPANLPIWSPPPLEEGKGPPASIRRDEFGRPEMPHENTAYLGRSLFTDYLLAVELGGTLLLVATIGAIAIAGRRGERSA